ncbi:glycosyltransferase [Aliarcobacter cryaerophilus]|uniref:Glycosyltransferase n=1 Tax=Aliarcobacter cryaerophilus TaxID=28198 RepID=A0AA46NMB7_9BACT|nr:glycosyltransferase [Aliarcobacter cryaerophilus]UYF42476.1 glycosyltransferase [Aliarcobacter cryaerophilus]
MTKLLLSIRSLDIGGAERQFIELVKRIDKSKFDVTVCTMYGGVQEDIVKNIDDIKYYNLQKTGRYDFYKFYKNYSMLLQKINPDVIYSFLGEMNLFSHWCKQKHTKIIWGFRASNMDLSQYGKVAQIIFWLQKKLSSRVDKIIANSNASIDFHKQNGFDMGSSVVIPNGVDTDRFQRDETKREEFRKKYNLKQSDIAVGIVARIDYMKGYLVFSQTAKKLIERYDNLYFFSVGGGDEKIKKECELVLGNTNRFIWLGNQKNVENFYSGFDISSSSSSFGEGFSNSIAEAMSCECACVVTDVGDSAMIVGEFGGVVEANSVDSLYLELEKMVQSDYKEFGKRSRQRIIDNFSIEKMVKNTEKEIVKCVE